MGWLKRHENELIVLGVLSLVPILPNPLHPEQHDGSWRPVCFWEWLYWELWEVYTGVEYHVS